MDMIHIDNGMVVLNTGRLEAYVYNKYLGNLAEIEGEIVNCIGIMPYKYYAKWDDEKPVQTGTIHIPSNVAFRPTELEMDVTATIYPESDPKDYMVMTFFEKEKCWANMLIQSMSAGMAFTRAMLAAKLDTNIPYNMLTPYWQQIGISNHFNIGISGPAMGIIVRHVCRYKKDRSVYYSQILAKNPKIGQVSYQLLNSRELCAESGVFSSMSFEDMNSAIDNSINITKQKKPQPNNSVEDIIYL